MITYLDDLALYSLLGFKEKLVIMDLRQTAYAFVLFTRMIVLTNWKMFVLGIQSL